MLNLITDRTQADVEYAKSFKGKEWKNLTTEQKADYLVGLKGTYSYIDFNRVGNAVEYLSNLLKTLGYDNNVSVKTNWTAEDIQKVSEIQRYIDNIAELRKKYYSNIEEELPTTSNWLTIEGANLIESLLKDIELVVESMSSYFVRCGVSNCGQSRMWQNRFRRYKKNVSGTEIEINDAGEVESVLHISGNSEQNAEPSPDNEVLIHSVKSKSDNLLNLSGVSNTDIGNLSNGEITLTWSSGFDCFLLHNSSRALTGLESNQSYTVSFSHKGNAVRLFDYNTSNGITTQNDDDYTQYSFVISGVTEIRLDTIRVDASGTAYIKDIMLNKGVEALPYQPYGYVPVEVKVEGENVEPILIFLPLGDIELRSINDIKDTFERVDGVWNKVENISRLIFTGNEIWSVANSPVEGTIHFQYPLKNAKSQTVLRCNRFVNKKTINGILYDSICNIYLDENYGITTKEQFSEWLTANPVTIDYVLAEPTYTPITNEALITALDELEELMLHKGYNYITATSVNGVKAYLDLTYYG